MGKIERGGYAFPATGSAWGREAGLTIRQYAVIEILKGILSRPGGGGRTPIENVQEAVDNTDEFMAMMGIDDADG